MHSDIPNLRQLLNFKYEQYATPAFIASDPIQVPRMYSRKEDIEVAAFLTATLAWGQRGQIVSHAKALLGAMGESPFEYVLRFRPEREDALINFYYRTFNGTDCLALLNALRLIYAHRGGLHRVFAEGYKRTGQVQIALHHFRTVLINENFPARTRKHIPDVMSGSAAKRLNLFLRWMVRPSTEGVDFGLWDDIPISALMLPLDVHSGSTARALGLLSRVQTDWRAVEEVTQNLRTFDPSDPIKYDFALFGMGAME